MKQIAVLLLSFGVLSGCNNKLYESNWYKPNIKKKTFRFYHAESKIRYNIENDSTDLYFSFDVMERITIQKILMTGLRLFVDGSGKNSERFEVQFPVYSDKVPVEEYRQFATDYDQFIQLGQRRMDELVPADGYLRSDGVVTQLFNRVAKDGLSVTMRFDSTLSLVYRATIPLDLLGELSGPIAIGLETGGFEMPRTDHADPNADVTRAGQGISAGDRAMGRGTSDPYGINSPSGSTAAGLAMRNSTAYNRILEPIRFRVKVKLSQSN